MPSAPELTKVLEALRAGQEVQVGGGRVFYWFAMKSGQLLKIHSDEGHLDEVPCTEAELEAELTANPQLFQFLKLG